MATKKKEYKIVKDTVGGEHLSIDGEVVGSFSLDGHTLALFEQFGNFRIAAARKLKALVSAPVQVIVRKPVENLASPPPEPLPPREGEILEDMKAEAERLAPPAPPDPALVEAVTLAVLAALREAQVNPQSMDFHGAPVSDPVYDPIPDPGHGPAMGQPAQYTQPRGHGDPNSPLPPGWTQDKDGKRYNDLGQEMAPPPPARDAVADGVGYTPSLPSGYNDPEAVTQNGYGSINQRLAPDREQRTRMTLATQGKYLPVPGQHPPPAPGYGGQPPCPLVDPKKGLKDPAVAMWFKQYDYQGFLAKYQTLIQVHTTRRNQGAPFNALWTPIDGIPGAHPPPAAHGYAPVPPEGYIPPAPMPPAPPPPAAQYPPAPPPVANPNTAPYVPAMPYPGMPVHQP